MFSSSWGRETSLHLRFQPRLTVVLVVIGGASTSVLGRYQDSQWTGGLFSALGMWLAGGILLARQS